jgi:2-polyprenyl-3-methyl-5-hydroxy-6-metoxy-1,4-benzoquinol methylase
VDEGWGRKAVDFATLSEPGNCREYVAMHHRLGVDAGDRLLDVACGAGLAIELARLRGASCSGIDASARLVAVARDRNPECEAGFHRAAVEQARQQLRDGLPLRADINVVGYLARKP